MDPETLVLFFVFGCVYFGVYGLEKQQVAVGISLDIGYAVESTASATKTEHSSKRRYRDIYPNQFNSSSNIICNYGNLEMRLQRLQTHLDGKMNALAWDIRASTRDIEQQTKAVKTAVEEFRNEITTEPERLRQDRESRRARSDPDLELKREMQITIATLRLLSSDLTGVRQNLSQLINTTNTIKDQQMLDSSIKQIFDPLATVAANNQQQTVPLNCLEIKQTQNSVSSSVFLIQPKTSKKPFFVYCDMDEHDGGWLTIHNRFAGEQDFYRSWQEYKIGFGNIAGEHWLGLEHVYELTGTEIQELLVQLVDTNDVKTYAYYSHFSVGLEEEGYALKVLGGFRGNAGDSLGYHAGSKFSTKDRDNDDWAEGHCAQSHTGAWWYKSCDKSNLNGRYLPGNQPHILSYQSMYWDGFTGPETGLKYARMLVRPKKIDTGL